VHLNLPEGGGLGMGLRERYDEVGAVRRRAQLGWEELSSQLVFLMPLIFIHQIRFILEALLQPIGPRVP
jgi:hypothetical protein